MPHADFAWVAFDQQFNSSNPVATRNFVVDGDPIGTGYLLIQHFDVEVGNHRILLNGQDLPSFDIPAQSTIDHLWQTWMDRIPAGFLHQGENQITVRRVTSEATEAFFVANIAIHWRENN